MFTEQQFTTLYQMLDLPFFNLVANIDCGSTTFSTCHRFCCGCNSKQPGPTKWLLPNEVFFLVENNFHTFADIQNLGYMFIYNSHQSLTCACEKIREYRPFCCRIFPFRPVLDVNTKKVTDIFRNHVHDSPCWISFPSHLWKAKAIQAWHFVFSDLDNLRFFSRIYLILDLAKKLPLGTSFSDAFKIYPAEERKILSIETLSLDELWTLSAKYFLST